jgi:hypothetical protein
MTDHPHCGSLVGSLSNWAKPPCLPSPVVNWIIVKAADDEGFSGCDLCLHCTQVEPGQVLSKFGTYVASTHSFDPQAYGLSAAEASQMDPQQRVLLEEVSLSLVHSGRWVGHRPGLTSIMCMSACRHSVNQRYQVRAAG